MNANKTQAQLEADWALKLQKSLLTKNSSNRPGIPLSTEKSQLQEEINYFKAKLSEAIRNHENEKMIKYFEIVCNTRARIAINNIKRTEKQLGQYTEASVKQETKKFVEECYKLYLALNRILKK